jgi:hypothetical protein
LKRLITGPRRGIGTDTTATTGIGTVAIVTATTGAAAIETGIGIGIAMIGTDAELVN